MLHVKILLAYCTELAHRRVYDEMYNPDIHLHKLNDHLLDQHLYPFLFWINPKFRKTLKHYQALFSKAYRLNRLSPQYFYLYKKLKKKNYKRYN